MRELEIQKLSSDDEHVILAVDFYARNGTELEYFNGRNKQLCKKKNTLYDCWVVSFVDSAYL